jgi:hypothetical protein
MIRRLIIILLSLALLSLPFRLAHAQSAPVLASLQISFWPEYDQPSTLVIYRGVLAADTPLPASLQFAIPAKYGPPIAVAFSDEQGQLLNLDYTSSVQGDQLIVAFDAPTTHFQFEYYDTGLDISTSTRHYSFTTSILYAINSLSLQVQQPVEAGDITTVPNLGSVTPGTDGLTYYEGLFTDISPNAPITLTASYTKSTSTLTANTPGLVATPQLPPLTSGSESLGTNTILLIAASLAGIVLVAGGVVWYLQTRRQVEEDDETEPQRRRKPKGQPPKPRAVSPRVIATPSESALPATFCHNCGQKSQPGDQFCRNCGTELRREA